MHKLKNALVFFTPLNKRIHTLYDYHCRTVTRHIHAELNESLVCPRLRQRVNPLAVCNHTMRNDTRLKVGSELAFYSVCPARDALNFPKISAVQRIDAVILTEQKVFKGNCEI